MQKSNPDGKTQEPVLAAAPAAENHSPASASEAAATHHRGVIRAASIVGVMTILSRVLGLWRFRLMAGIFGATSVADAFNFAFIFPNLTRRLFGEGALTSAFVPIFSDRLAKGENVAASRTGSILLCRLTYWLSMACLILIGLAYIARAVWSQIGGLTADDDLFIKLCAFMLPYMVFINVSAVLMGALNAMGHFWMPAFAPVLLNVFMIGACYFTLDWFGPLAQDQIWAVAIAVILGGISQILIQVPPAISRGFKFKFSMDQSDTGYQEIMNNFKPVLFLVAVFQVNVMMDNIIAKTLIAEDGPVTYLNMGTSVYQLPWSVFSLALGTAALPALSKFWALQQKEEFRKTLLSSCRLVLFLAVPCTVGIMLLSEDLVRLLYGTGKFLDNGGEPIRRTAGVVMFSSLGLVFFSINAVLARALYAMKDMRTPTTTSAKSVALNLVLNLVFVKFTPLKEGGIALASTISNAWQTWMLLQAVQQQVGPIKSEPAHPQRQFGLLFGITAIFSAGMAMYAYDYAASRKEWEGFYGFFLALALSLAPLILLARQYFTSKLAHCPQSDATLHPYGIEESHWPESLKFQYSIYSTTVASIIMGFAVWAARDSLPPQGHTFLLVLQRAMIPIGVGMVVYGMASSGLLAREYNEIRSAFAVKWRKKTQAAA